MDTGTLLEVVESAVRSAYPDRATPLIQEVERWLWFAGGSGSGRACVLCDRSALWVRGSRTWDLDGHAVPRVLCDACTLVSIELLDGAGARSRDSALAEVTRAVRALGTDAAERACAELARLATTSRIPDVTGPATCGVTACAAEGVRVVRSGGVRLCEGCLRRDHESRRPAA